ncbi:MAG: hypothetical protein AB1490_06930 [Pseudomonadota bacterium]
MKKLALMVALAMAVTSPAFAAKKMKREMEVIPPKVDTNEASFRFVRDAFPVVLPSYVMPVYLKIKEDQDKAAAPAKVRKSKHKRHAA